MHGSKTYLWYADHGARGTNFNLASHLAWISGKKIENNNIFFMEPLAAGEISLGITAFAASPPDVLLERTCTNAKRPRGSISVTIAVRLREMTRVPFCFA